MAIDVILGASGFLGGNLADALAAEGRTVVLFDRAAPKRVPAGCRAVQGNFTREYDYDGLVRGAERVFHLVSTSRPYTRFEHEFTELEQNVAPTLSLLEACARQGVRQVVFLSSGGTIYGQTGTPPYREDDIDYPICSYGLQKLFIEKYLYYYRKTRGLDYRIVRLSNPYGPGQVPGGGLGAVTTFCYNAVHGLPIEIFGTGETVRDYIWVGDAMRGIRNISAYEGERRLFNLGSGTGESLNRLVECIERHWPGPVQVSRTPARPSDVPTSILDIGRYKAIAPDHTMLGLDAGVRRMLDYFGSL